jgi:hypothetical protein
MKRVMLGLGYRKRVMLHTAGATSETCIAYDMVFQASTCLSTPSTMPNLFVACAFFFPYDSPPANVQRYPIGNFHLQSNGLVHYCSIRKQ